MRAALTIFAKDLRLRVRDKSVFLFAFVVPFGLTVVFSFIFPEAEDFRLTAAVIDLDGGEVAQGFVAGVVPALEDAGVLDRVEVDDEAGARAAIEAGDISAAWIIPDGFTGRVTSGQPARIDVLVNPDRTLSAEVARSVAHGYAVELERTSLAVATAVTAAGADVAGDAIGDMAVQAAAAEPAVSLHDLVTEERRLDEISYLSAGMAVFFLFFIVQYGVTGLLEERQLGTLPRLLAAPIGVAAVHVGKALGAFVLGVVSLTVLAVGANLLLDATWGHPVGVAIMIGSSVLAALGIMALVGSFARTAEQAGNFQSIVALVLGLLGGVFFPVGGETLARLSVVSPHSWFLRGLADLVGTGEWTAVLPAAGALLAFGLVAAIPGVLRLRRATP